MGYHATQLSRMRRNLRRRGQSSYRHEESEVGKAFEEQERTPGSIRVARGRRDDFHAIGESVAALERGRPAMHRGIAANGVGVAT